MNIPVTDGELIAKVLVDGDRNAFGSLVLSHQSAVRRFARHLCGGDHAWADDIAQDAFITAFQTLHRFHNQAAFRTWVLGIAHNHFRNGRRKLRTALRDPLNDEEVSGSLSPAVTVAMASDLEGALKKLSEDERLAVHLCCQLELTHVEAALVALWPLGTLKTHLLRGKDKLREYLSAWNPSP